MRALACRTVTAVTSTIFLACLGATAACGPKGGGTGGGHSTTTSSAHTTTGETSSGSTTSGDTCSDSTEPNDSLSDPAFFNDAGNGLSICDHTGLSQDASLQDASDVDWFRGYSMMASGCTPAPTAVFSGAAAAALCFYLQDDATGPVVKSCPAGTTLTSEPTQGYTGCCAPAAASASITLTDIADLDTATANTQFAVQVSSSASTCNAYTVSVHF
jgi:hypothetical protein